MLQTYETEQSRVETASDPTFDKIFVDYMKSRSPVTVSDWEINPKQAKKLLCWNTNNRRVKKSLVAHLARDMKNGHWHYTGEPLIFSASRLLDGQHRLKACVEAGVSFRTSITFGVEDAAFAYIDAGATRSPGDVFEMYGVKNARNMAAATKIVHAYKTGQLAGLKKARNTLNHEELYSKFCEFDGLADGAKHGTKWQSEKLCTSNAVTAAFYICQEINRDQAETFFTQVGDSVGFNGRNDPGLVLQRFLRRNREIGYSIRNYDALGAILTGWNAYRKKRRPRSLAFSLGDPCPEAI